MNLQTKLYAGLTLVCATAVTVWSLQYKNESWLAFSLFLVAVLLGSGLKVALPRGDGGMSFSFPFLFLAIVRLSPLQAVLLGAISIAAQYWLKVAKIFTLAQIFNVASTMAATGMAYATYLLAARLHAPLTPALSFAATTYFLVSTVSAALVHGAARGEDPLALWKKEFPWYLPFYLVGAVLAAATDRLTGHYGWATSLLLIPIVYTLYRAYNAQMGRRNERAQHLEETESLHRRTIEGLSMAIEAKDQKTHEHLFRVRNYVAQLGLKLGLNELDLQALHTASFLHDIGKLAVPEHIINKPGKLTPEEFEKMKIHPVVGADILERVRFPYPVVPIVRSHHEWWNGTGYPDGLRGEEIPVGARVLSAADCFDAMVSDRPYRRGISVAEALAHLKRMAGVQFDPQVVAMMETLYTQLNEETNGPTPGVAKRSFSALNTEVEVWRGQAPGAGFEEGRPVLGNVATIDSALRRTMENLSLNRIAAASQQAQALFEMNQSPGVSLSLDETAAVIASRLRKLIPFDSCALYLRSDDELTLRYIDGENARSFTHGAMPLGEGISGWVAQSGKPLLNGDASLESSYRRRVGVTGELRSALSVPLFDLEEGVFGVLTLYSMTVDAFQRDHLRILLAMSSKLSLSLQNSLQFQRVQADTKTAADTDVLTGLPNARRLFVQLAQELEECQSTGRALAVVVCNLNRFKEITDQRGHLTGNRFLGMMAESFLRTLRAEDTVARMGGNEFVFLLQDISSASLALRLAEIAETVRTTSRRAALGVAVTGSLGAAVYPVDGNTAEDLLALADRRMYLEKHKAASLIAAETGIRLAPALAS